MVSPTLVSFCSFIQYYTSLVLYEYDPLKKSQVVKSAAADNWPERAAIQASNTSAAADNWPERALLVEIILIQVQLSRQICRNVCYCTNMLRGLSQHAVVKGHDGTMGGTIYTGTVHGTALRDLPVVFFFKVADGNEAGSAAHCKFVFCSAQPSKQTSMGTVY